LEYWRYPIFIKTFKIIKNKEKFNKETKISKLNNFYNLDLAM